MLLALLGRENDGADVGAFNEQSATEDTEPLRVAAVFIILSAGLLGGVPPLFLKSLQNQDSLPTFIVRSFAAGIILALSLVHIVPDAIEELNDIGGVSYPLGGTCVMFGILVMVFIEHVAHIMYGGHHAHHSGTGHDRSVASAPATPAPGATKPGALLERPQQGPTFQKQSHCCGHGEASSEGDGASGDVRAKDGAGGYVPPPPLLSSQQEEKDSPEVEQGAQTGEHRQQQQQQQQQQAQQQEQEQQQQEQQLQLQGGQGTQLQQRQRLPEGGEKGRFGWVSVNGQQLAELPAAGDQPRIPHVQGTASLGPAPGFVRHSAGPSVCVRMGSATAPGADPDSPWRPESPLSACSMPLLGSQHRNVHSNAEPAVIADGGSGGNRVAAAAAGPLGCGGGGSGMAQLAAGWPVLQHCQTGHAHDCVSRSSAPNWASVVEVTAEVGAPLRLRIIAYLFELGCIFHSFIIGLSLGVNTTSLSEVRALLIALSFHQALEGLSLASVINGGGFSTAKAALMVAMYSVTCPAGVAVGIAIASSYDAESTRARAAQGCLNGVSGGMLLYISLVQLVAEDMGKYLGGGGAGGGHSAEAPAGGSETKAQHACHGRPAGDNSMGYRIRLPSFLAFCAGAASMCLLAVWA